MHLKPLHFLTAAWVVCIFATAPSHADSTKTSTPSTTNQTDVSSGEIPKGLLELGIGHYYSPYAFVVNKDARKLTVWHEVGTAIDRVKSYPIDLGRGGGEKEKSGDLNTPDGIYFLIRKLEGPSLDFSRYGSIAFVTNYPNLFDRREGKTGDGIWLHAVPDTVPLSRGSLGCVVVRNNVIKKLAKYVKVGLTPLLIYTQVPEVSEAQHTADLNAIKTMVNGWRKAWENKDMKDYMGYYASSFHSLHMNRAQWKAYKNRLAQDYGTIQVRISEPVVYSHDNQAIARFLQSYVSNKKMDYGEKALYLKKKNGKWKIIAEQWTAVHNPIAYQDLPRPTRTAVCVGGSCSKSSAKQRSEASLASE